MESHRNSIMRSALKAFAKAFMTIIGLLLGIAFTAFALMFITAPFASPDKSRIELVPDANGSRMQLPDTAPIVLKVNIHGVIGSKELPSKSIETILLDSQSPKFFQKGRVKAVLLTINSPGGGAVESDQIYTHLMTYKKRYNVPVYAYVEGMCASGGMLIAATADKIYSMPSGIIGSIGTILGPNFNLSGLMEMLGVSQVTLTQGKDKDVLNPYRPWKKEEYGSIETIMAYDYNRFVDIMTTARPQIDKDKLVNEYGAQVYDPPTAEKIGYIDNGNATYAQALTDLVAAAGIEGEYQVVALKVPRPFLTDLMLESKSPLLTGKIEHTVSWPHAVPPELANKVLYLYRP